jgi:hypothetical protein
MITNHKKRQEKFLFCFVYFLLEEKKVNKIDFIILDLIVFFLIIIHCPNYGTWT